MTDLGPRDENLRRDMQESSSVPGSLSAVQKGHDLIRLAGNLSCGYKGPVDQDHRQAKLPRGDQLGFSPRAASILGNDHLDPVGLQQGPVTCRVKGAAGNDHLRIRQGQRPDRRVHKAQKIVVLTSRRKGGKVLPTDGEEHPPRGSAKDGGGLCKVSNMRPAVAVASRPGRALQRNHGDARDAAGLCGVLADPRGKRVGGVDQMADVLGAQIGHQAIHPAEPADANRQGLRHGGFGPSGIGIDCINARLCQGQRHLRGFGRSAQKKDAWHD